MMWFGFGRWKTTTFGWCSFFNRLASRLVFVPVATTSKVPASMTIVEWGCASIDWFILRTNFS